MVLIRDEGCFQLLRHMSHIELLTVFNNILLLLGAIISISLFMDIIHLGKTWLEKHDFVIVKGRKLYLSTYIDVDTIRMEEKTWRN